MKWRNVRSNYGIISKLLHGLLILLIFTQFSLGLSFSYVNQAVFPTLMMYHKSVGFTTLMVSVLFLLWRLMSIKPDWPSTMLRYEQWLARLVHALLYLLIIVMPLSGWIMSVAAGYIPSYFGWFAVPFPGVGFNKALAAVCSEVHEIAAWSFAGLLILHILGALKHHLLDKNNILRRMF